MSRKRRRKKNRQNAKGQSKAESGQKVSEREVDGAHHGSFLEHFSLTISDLIVFVVVLVIAGLLVKYFGEDRVLTIHFSIVLIVVALLFVVLRFNVWFMKEVNRTPFKSKLKKFVWLGWLVTLPVGKVIDQHLVTSLQIKAPSLEEPAFEENVTEAEFSLGGGGMHFYYSLAALEGIPKAPMVIAGQAPFQMYVRGRRLFLDTALVGTDGGPLVQIQGNRFTVGTTAWDHNSAKQALEIVDSNQNPVLQVIYRSSTHIEIDGLFSSGGVLFWATPFGTETNPKPPLRHLKRIFKYPSWRYPGVFESP